MQQDIAPTDAGDTSLTKIEANFTELYTGANIHSADSKTTPADADEIGLIDSAASYVLKKLTWANLKATILAYFTTVTTTWTNKTLTSPVINGTLTGTAGFGAWTTWTPTWTNLTVGSGTTVAKYTQIGKTVHGYLNFTLASDSSISGNVLVSLPVTASSNVSQNTTIGNARFDQPTGYIGFLEIETSTTGQVVCLNAIGTYIRQAALGATSPFTWGTGNVINIIFTYEAA